MASSAFITRSIALAFVLTVFCAAPVGDAVAESLEYPYIYKSPRSMGMGGTGVAIGGEFDSVFINPAGLSAQKPGNWQVDILNLSVSYGQNVQDFADDMDKALDVGDLNGDGDASDDEMTATNDVLRRYRGSNLHLSASDLTSISRGGEGISWGVGAVGAFSMDAVSHQGVGMDGLLEVNAKADYGMVLAAGFNGYSSFRPGVALKLLKRESLYHNFSARELVEHEDDLDDYLTDKLVQEGTAFGLDVGAIYQFKDVNAEPAIGASVLNLGNLDFGGAGVVPMSLNIGMSLRFADMPVLGDVVCGLDMADVTGEFEQDMDTAKRVRMGAEAAIVDNEAMTLSLRGGLYQGYATYGLDVRLLLFSFSYNSYAEELGAYAGQDPDRRHMFNFTLGW